MRIVTEKETFILIALPRFIFIISEGNQEKTDFGLRFVLQFVAQVKI